MNSDKKTTSKNNPEPPENSNAANLITFIAVISVIIIIIISMIVYKVAFKKEITKEKNSKIINKEISETLEEQQKNASNIRKENDNIIAEYESGKINKEISEKTGNPNIYDENATYKFEIYGKYSMEFNEFTDDAVPGEGMGYTEHENYTLEIKDDYSANISTGEVGLWQLLKSDESTLHAAVSLPPYDEENYAQMYLICDNALVDERYALFFGEIPDTQYFDTELTDGSFTITFKSDGSVNAIYVPSDTQDKDSIPLNQAFSGSYIRNGDFLDINLNGANSKYYIFNNTRINPGLKGIAARYYIKQPQQGDDLA